MRQQSLVAMWYTIYFLVDVVVCKDLRLEVFRPTADGNYQLYHTLSVDGQKEKVLVDTGSEVPFFVWKTWYEGPGGGRCQDLFWGCYDRSLPYPSEHDIETITFLGGRSIDIFPYSGHVQFGTFMSTNTMFGLVCGSSPPRGPPPVAIFGLSPRPHEGWVPSFMKQLLNDPSRPLSGSIFALYLEQDNSDLPVQYNGYLLLGRGDPSVYEGPLRYIPAIDLKRRGWAVRLGCFQFKDSGKTDAVDDIASIDSGSNGFTIPQYHKESIIPVIEMKASEAARTTVELTFDASTDLYFFNCNFLKFMPLLYLGLGPVGGEVTIEISHKGYFLSKRHNRCYLGMFFGNSNLWYIPDTALIGNYFEFDEDGKRIGYAKLVPRLA